MLQSQKKSVSNNNNSLFHYFPADIKTDLIAAGILLFFLITFRFLAIENMSRYYLGSVQGDTGLYLWLLKSNFHDLFHLPWFEKNAFYPYANVLAWSDNFILPSLAAKLLFTAGFSETTVYNLIILVCTFLNGFLTYLTAARLSGEKFASLFAGCSFMTLPYFTHQLGHPQLQFFFFIPLGFIFFVRLINKPSYLNAALLCLNISAAFLTAVTYSIFTALIYILLFTSVKLLKPSIKLSLYFKKLLFPAILTVFLMLQFVNPYLSVQDTFGERQIYEAYYFAADFFSYLSSTPYNFLYDASKVLSQSEAHLFPGLTLLTLTFFGISRIGEAKTLKFSLILNFTLILISLILAMLPSHLNLKPLCSILLWGSMLHSGYILYRLGKLELKLNVSSVTARDLTAIFAFTGLVFFIISLGPLGNPEKKQLAIAPFSFFYTVMPGFSSIRAISRAGSVVLFCGCIISALYFSILFKKKAFRGIAVLAFAFMLLENYTTEYPLSALPKAPENFKNLAANEGIYAAAVLPLAGRLDTNGEVESWSEYAKINLTYLLWGENKVPLLNGYSGQKTKIMRSFPRELKDFPSQRSLNALSTIAGLNYIVYTPQMQDNFNKVQFEKNAASFGSQLKLVTADSSGTYLFKFTPELQTSRNKTIWVPSAAETILSFEARTLFKQDKNKVKLDVFLNEDISTIFSQHEITADGSMNTVKIKIPAFRNSTKPHLLSLKTEDESVLIIKNINIEN